MKAAGLSCLLLLLPAVAPAAPPRIPATAHLLDMDVQQGAVREFEVEMPRSAAYLAWNLVAVNEAREMSGTLLLSLPDGRPLREVRLDGLRENGGLVDVPKGAARRAVVSLRGGDKDMRVDMSLLPSRGQLKANVPVAVFPRRRGSQVINETLDLRLIKPANVDIRTWGGNAELTLTVHGNGGPGVPTTLCEDRGDAWRQCTLPALPAGVYQVTLTGSGAPVNVLASWEVVEPPGR